MPNPPKNKLPLVLEKSAGAVVYFNTDPVEYLLLRAKHWDFPKGLVEAGESDEQAARREVKEESGLDVALNPHFEHTIQYFYRRKDSGALVKKQAVYFLGEANTRDVHISWEHHEARWVTYAQALELIEFKGARELLEKANAELTDENTMR